MKLSEPDVPESNALLSRKHRCNFGMLNSVYKSSLKRSHSSILNLNSAKQKVKRRQFQLCTNIGTTLKVTLFFIGFLLVIY